VSIAEDGDVGRHLGIFREAHKGTVFLDEIGELPKELQPKLLRVLERHEVKPVGALQPIKIDVRVIAATNRDLAGAILRGAFRDDLFYRLNVFQIPIAPLRRRPEDVLPLAEAFLEDLGRSMGRPAAGISRDARDWMLTYPWPGNVRELRNAIERAILLCDGGLITQEHLPVPIADFEPPLSGLGAGTPGAPLPPGGVDLEDVERDFVAQALGQAKGNKSKAARLLGLTRAQLYSRLEKYGISD